MGQKQTRKAKGAKPQAQQQKIHTSSQTRDASHPYYIDLEHEGRVWVDREVYLAYKRPEWREHQRMRNEGRCSVPSGQHGTKRCGEDCATCPFRKTGFVLSLDRLFEDSEFEAADRTQSLVEEVISGEEREAEIEEASKGDPVDLEIFSMWLEGRTERETAAEVGLSQKAVDKRLHKILPRVAERLRAMRGLSGTQSGGNAPYTGDGSQEAPGKERR